MKKFFSVTLGILTAIGGFVDIGDLVTNAQVGARFGMVARPGSSMLGVVGHLRVRRDGRPGRGGQPPRPTFDLVRERLGPRVGLAQPASARWSVTLLTFIAEVGGVALALAAGIVSVNYLLLDPPGRGASCGSSSGRRSFSSRWRTIARPAGPRAGRLRRRAVAARPRLGVSSDTHQLVTVDKPADEPWPVLGLLRRSRCSARP